MHSSETLQLSRRSLLAGSSFGLGSAALSHLLADSSGTSKLIGKAKRVIFLCMSGGPSHLETFDYKPELDKLNGQPMPESFTKGQPIAQLQGQKLKVQGHLTKFKRYGKSGQYISDFLPHTAKMADEIAIIRSMVTEQINHDPAHTFLSTGTAISGHPSMGAWITYGLGSATKNLPAFVVLTSTGGRNPQPIASRQWGAGFLPSRYQGVEFNSTGDPVHYVRSPKGIHDEQQAALVNTIKKLDKQRNNLVNNPEIQTRIAAYEMAFRMQSSVPELMDLSDEPASVLEHYGAKPGDGSYASNCLLARRLAERGVRFIQLYQRGWDHHGNLPNRMKQLTGLTDQPTAALLGDLKSRGMLEDTLVIWGGEFGRTIYCQGKLTKQTYGRDHHPNCFSMWMAGGGVKGGMTYGSTDDYSVNVVDKGVHIHDLQATILNQLGVDHERLTFKHQGRHYRLTDVYGHVVKDILA